MAKKVHRIDSMPRDSPWDGGLPPAGSDEHPRAIRALDVLLNIQRPAVLTHLRSVRLRHPEATPAQIQTILERRYLAAVTSGGAAVGATAVVPGIGTVATLGLSGVETAGFLEATTLFAQSLAELHALPVDDPDRARALVLTLMLGTEGVDLLKHLAGQFVGKRGTIDGHWGNLITNALPRAAMGPLVDQLKSAFVRHFATRGGVSILGKALPFGIGAAIGGAGNAILGRRVIVGSRRAFGIAPAQFPVDTDPRPGSERLEHSVVRGVRSAGTALGVTSQRVAEAITARLPRRGEKPQVEAAETGASPAVDAADEQDERS